MTTAGPDSGAGLAFPPGFIWGTATAAYQIEGAVTEDGRGPSIWDTFSHTPGAVVRGDTGDIACDSYHRYAGDVALMASLGLSGYRFSVSWPRVQPGGSGPVNQRGLDYYRALLDELARRGIMPMITLYHWDLPQELQDAGGWAARDTAARFADYAALMAAALGDYPARWLTLNEPQVSASHGYRTGEHAPGLRDDAAARAATHHLLLAHGLGLAALRAALPAGRQAGLTMDLHPVLVPGGVPDDAVERARAATDAELNGLFLDPVLHGRYPAAARAAVLPEESLIRDGDLALISAPVDFLGINYYAPVYLRAGDPADLRQHETLAVCELPGVVEYKPAGLPRTPMGWVVDPDGLYELLMRLAKQAPGLPLVITENGCAADDYVSPEGVINDADRIRYLHGHLTAAARAIRDGAPLFGYHQWSMLDNFEWGWGYQKRFGTIWVDYATQQRIPKASAAWYAELARTGTLPPLPD